MAEQWAGLDWKSQSPDLSLALHYIITCILTPYSGNDVLIIFAHQHERCPNSLIAV